MLIDDLAACLDQLCTRVKGFKGCPTMSAWVTDAEAALARYRAHEAWMERVSARPADARALCPPVQEPSQTPTQTPPP